MRKLIFWLAYFGSIHIIYAQNVTVTSTPSCQLGAEVGSFVFDFADDILAEYPLPYSLELEHDQTGAYEEYIIDSDLFELDQLAYGTYHLLFNLTEDCFIKKRNEVIRALSDEPLWFRDNNRHICNDDPGQLTVNQYRSPDNLERTLEDDYSLYSIPYASGVNTITPSSPGKYCVTATNDEGCEKKLCKHVYSLSEKIIVEEVIPETECITALGEKICCSQDGAITISENTSFGGSVERYEWQGPDGFRSSEPNLTNLSAGEYKLYISFYLPRTDFVYQECPIIVNVPGLDHFEAIKVRDSSPSCDGINEGQYSFTINNPNGDRVDVYYPVATCEDCGLFPIVDNSEHYSIDLNFTDLFGDRDYTFPIRIGSCHIPFTFNVGDRPTWRTLSGVEDRGDYEFYCTYDIRCGTDIIVEDGASELATIDANEDTCEPGNPFSSCGQIDYYCDDHRIDSRRVRRRPMRRLEAWTQAQAMGLSDEVLELHLSGAMCDILWVCPNNPLCMSVTLSGEFSGTDQGIERLSNGCIKVNCTSFWIWNRDYTVCGLDFVPDYIRPYVNVLSGSGNNPNERNCVPVTKNVAQLVHFMPELAADHANFVGSSLFDFLKESQNKPERYCADVTYCRNDFSFESSNIGSINCGPLNPPIQTGAFQVSSTCELLFYGETDRALVYCEGPCVVAGSSNCVYPNEISFDYSQFEFTRDNSPSFRHIIGHEPSTSRFGRFSKSKFDGGVKVDAIFKYNEENVYHSFRPDKRVIEPGFDIEYLYREPDNDILIAVIKTEKANAFELISADEDGITYVNSKISGSDKLEIDALEEDASKMIVSGAFKGKLNYNGSLLASSTKIRKFNLVLSKGLTVETLFEFGYEDIITSSDRKEDAGAISGGKSGTTYTTSVGSSEYIEPGSIKLITDIKNGQGTELDLKLSGDLMIEKISYSGSKELAYMIFSGIGTVVKNEKVLWTSSANDISLMSYNLLNGSMYFGLINGINTSIDDIKITVGSDNSLIASLNYQETVIVNDETFMSTGLTDILILQFNSELEVFNTLNYGSVDNERVSDIFIDSDILYIGGELDGSTYSRTIGDMEFINLSGGTQQAYLSFVNLSPKVETKASKNESRSETSNLQKDIVLYPNPTSDMLYIRSKEISKMDLNHSYLVDAKGIQVSSVEDMAVSNEGDLVAINVAGLPSGVYFIKIRTDKSYSTFKFIKFN